MRKILMGFLFCILPVQLTYTQFPALIDLGNFQEDVRLISSQEDVLLGRDLATGDLNNDGFDDLIMGGYGASGPDGLGVGNVYIVFGDTDLFPAFSINRPGENRTIVFGDDEQDLTGLSVACGDVNNDGYDDAIIGAPQLWKPIGGLVYIIYGSASWPREIDLNTNGKPIAGITRITGKRMPGVLGASLASGDVNGDGICDVVMGDIAAGPPGGFGNEGEVYVLYGRSALFPKIIHLDTLSQNITTVQGVAEGQARIGEFIGCLDVDSNGYREVLVGAPAQKRGTSAWRTGRAYLIYGSEEMPEVVDLDSSSTDSVRITQIIGENTYDYFGWSFAGGDVNGDSYPDLLVGTQEYIRDYGWDDGKMYVLFGPLPDQPSIDMRTYANQMKIVGPDPEGAFGKHVASGDINNDGLADILVGAELAKTVKKQEGKAWLIYGRENFPAILDLKKPANLSGTSQILGYQSYQELGRPVATGDINGDAISDVIVSAHETKTPSGYLSGEVYIIYGRRHDAPPVKIENPHLLQSYPNPFNSYTIIPYQLERGQRVTLKIYNSLGQEVRTLVDGWVEAGLHRAVWDGYNSSILMMGSGIYYCRLIAETFTESRKLLYLK